MDSPEASTSNNGHEDDKQCSICHDDVTCDTVILECKHLFHLSCVKGLQSAGFFTCPSCRYVSPLLKKQLPTKCSKPIIGRPRSNITKRQTTKKNQFFKPILENVSECTNCKQLLFGLFLWPCNHRLCTKCITNLSSMTNISPNERCPHCMVQLRNEQDDDSDSDDSSNNNDSDDSDDSSNNNDSDYDDRNPLSEALQRSLILMYEMNAAQTTDSSLLSNGLVVTQLSSCNNDNVTGHPDDHIDIE